MNDEIINGDLEPNTPPFPAEPSPCPVDADSVPAAPEFEGFPAADPRDKRIRQLEAENARLKTVAELRRVDARAVREELDRIADWIVEDYPYDLPPKGEGNRLSEWNFARGFLKRVRQIQASNTDNVRFNPDPRIADLESQLATVTARESALRKAVAGLAGAWRGAVAAAKAQAIALPFGQSVFTHCADQLDAILKGADE